MGFYKPATRAYMGVLMALALVVVIASWVLNPESAREHLLPFAVLTLLAAVAHLYPIRSGREGTFFVVANVFVFAAVVMLPRPLLSLLCLLTMLPTTIWNRKQPRIWYRWAFNSAQTILAAQAARFAVQAGGGGAFDGPLSLVVVMAAVVIFPLVQGAMVAGAQALNNSVRFVDAEPLQPEGMLPEVIMGVLGAVIAALWHAQPWFLGMLPVPIVITYSLMRRVQMIRLVDIDAKTGLYNYRYFEQAVNQELRRARPVRRATGLMFMDLDYLRHINNRYGHLAGDHVLKEVAALLTRELRSGDLVARFGGEEFVAMLPGTDRAEAAYVAERIRRAVEKHTFVFDGQTIRATISIGVVAYPVDGTEPTDLIRLADELLYAAKARGRNCVQVAGEQEEQDADSTRRPALVPMQGAGPCCDEVAAALQAFPTPHSEPEGAEAAPPEAAKSGAEAVALPTPRSGNLVLWAVAVAGGLAGIWVAAGAKWPYPHPMLLALLSGIAVFGELLKVQVYAGDGNKVSLSFSTGAICAAITLLDPTGALIVGVVGGLTSVVINRRAEVAKTAFNLGNVCLATAAAALAYAGAPVAPVVGISPGLLVGAGVVTVTFYVVNTGLLCLAIAVRTRRNLFAVWRENLWFAPGFMLSGATGAFLGGAYSVIGPLGTAVFLTPILVLRHSFSLYFQKTQQSITDLKQAMEAVEAADTEKERTLDQLIVTIAAIIDARDRSVYGHSRQVARYSVSLAEEMGLPADLLPQVRVAALLHDLGKIGIPESILHKPGRLTAEEYSIVKHHAPLGAQILSEVSALKDVARMVGEHHEHFNGGGYPSGKSGEEITVGGRIIAVADTLDTILSDRPYSRAKPLSWALEELQRCAGSQFDPQVVQALLRLTARQERSFFVNSARTSEDKVRSLFSIAVAKVASEPAR